MNETQTDIISCVMNYVDGWYTADPGKIDMALAESLVKRRIVSDQEIWSVSKEWMVNATKEGNGKIDNPKQGKKDITILDYTQTMASVKLTSELFDDYLLLAKINTEWKIYDALWDYISK